MTELYDKINQVINACNHADLKVSGEAILEGAIRIYNTEYIQNNKRTPTKNAEMPSTPATEKQISALNKMKIDYNEGITKQEAFKLIGDKIESGKKN